MRHERLRGNKSPAVTVRTFDHPTHSKPDIPQRPRPLNLASPPARVAWLDEAVKIRRDRQPMVLQHPAPPSRMAMNKPRCKSAGLVCRTCRESDVTSKCRQSRVTCPDINLTRSRRDMGKNSPART